MTATCWRRAYACSKASSAARKSPTPRSSRCSGLSDALGIRQSICLIRPEGEQSLFVVGAYGLGSAVTSYSVSLEDWSNPLVSAFNQRKELFFPAPHSAADRKRRPSTPLEDAAFHAVPLGVPGYFEKAFGLLLVGGAPALVPELHWFVNVFSQKLDQMLRQQVLAEEDRKQGRERTLLYNIINAVSDPILLTDTEGRLLIANARALTLFTASEEESEGRRGAVRMNNMLLSSALSSKAIEETGATRRELLLVNPVDGSDLVFELLSTVTEDPRQGSGVVSILRNVTDLRRASEEIEDNYRKMRIAEVQARAESDRLNLIIDSVADPIVVTDAGGGTSLMNEPAERLFTIPLDASEIEQRWVQANDAHFSSFIAGMLVSADQRRVGEIGLSDPRTGEPMPVEAIAGKVLSEHGELTAVVTILHDRREALEKARLYAQLQVAADELERRIQAATADIAQQNELLRRQAIELEQASALKSQFLANMSHEFRTPLNAMLGYTSMLLQGVAGAVEPPVKRQLGRIESNGRHLLTIINEILDISRIEAGQDAAADHDVQGPRPGQRGQGGARADHHAAEADGHDRRAARARPDLERPPEGEADPAEPAQQLAEVHAPRRRDHRREAQRQREDAGAVGRRYRHRHRERGPGQDLRGFPAAR